MQVTAKFISARALKDGTITYTLTGEGGKDALRAAVDLQGEECVIELNTPKDMTTLEALYHEYRDAIQFMEGLKAKAYEKGINRASMMRLRRGRRRQKLLQESRNEQLSPASLTSPEGRE